MLFKVSNGGKLHYGKNLNTSLCGIKKDNYNLVRGNVECKRCISLHEKSIKNFIESVPAGSISGPKIKVKISVIIRSGRVHKAMVKNGNFIEIPFTIKNLNFVKGITNNYRMVK